LQNAEHALGEACSDEVSAEKRAVAFTIGGPMPKAKPISLHPMSFDQAIESILKATPKPQKKKSKGKPQP
jgi:hypothetical protein